MKKFRNVLAVMFTVVIGTVMMMLPASATCYSYDLKSAESLPSGVTKSVNFIRGGDASKSYVINLSKSGELKVTIDSDAYYSYVTVFDSNGEAVVPDNLESTVGYCKIINSEHAKFTVNENLYESSGYVSYKLKSGKYYICIDTTQYGINEGKVTFKADFPSNTSTGAATKSITLKITLYEGDTLQLGAVLSPTNAGKVTYSSSKPSCVSVTADGEICAERTGNAVITLKSGNKKLNVRVQVI